MFSFKLFLALCSAVVSSFTCEYLVKVYYTQQLCANGAWGMDDGEWWGRGQQIEKRTEQGRSPFTKVWARDERTRSFRSHKGYWPFRIHVGNPFDTLTLQSLHCIPLILSASLSHPLIPMVRSHISSSVIAVIFSKVLISSILISDYPYVYFLLTSYGTSALKMTKHTWVFNSLTCPYLQCIHPFITSLIS